MQEQHPPKRESWPPGEFVTDEQHEATKRFVEQARTLAGRRTIPPPLDDERDGGVSEVDR